MSGARGESTIQLPDGGEVVVLFTNRALVEAEKALGRSILAVAQGFGDGDIGVGDVAQLLLVGMRAARRDGLGSGSVPTIDTAYTVMDAVGFAQVSADVVSAVAEVLGYGQGGETNPNA